MKNKIIILVYLFTISSSVFAGGILNLFFPFGGIFQPKINEQKEQNTYEQDWGLKRLTLTGSLGTLVPPVNNEDQTGVEAYGTIGAIYEKYSSKQFGYKLGLEITPTKLGSDEMHAFILDVGISYPLKTSYSPEMNYVSVWKTPGNTPGYSDYKSEVGTCPGLVFTFLDFGTRFYKIAWKDMRFYNEESTNESDRYFNSNGSFNDLVIYGGIRKGQYLQKLISANSYSLHGYALIGLGAENKEYHSNDYFVGPYEKLKVGAEFGASWDGFLPLKFSIGVYDSNVFVKWEYHLKFGSFED